MSATLTLSTINAAPAQRNADPQDPGSAPQASAPVVNSTELLKGARSIGIEHKGAFYRLQETKLGKLILTK
ncbi:MAG: hemin uptake protein HemP [Pseudomonadota bacterium]